MRIARTRRTELIIPRLPLVALIDVVFFLLLYFIMAGNLAPIENNLGTALKTDAKGKGQDDLVPQILSVERSESGGALYKLGQQVLGDEQSVRALLSKLPKSAGVVVRVSDQAPAWAAAAAVQACKDAGFTKVSYVPRRS